MAQKLTPQAQGILEQTTKNMNMIVEIEDIYPLFSTGDVETYWRIGDDGVYVGDDIEIGGTIISPRSMPCIDIDRSTKSVSQQLSFEEGGASSIQSMNVCLIDNAAEISALFSTENNPDRDILGRKVKISFAFAGSSYPEDAFKVFNGVIVDVDNGLGYIMLKINHVQKLEERDLFIKKTATLTQDLTNSATTLYIDRPEILIPNPLNTSIELRLKDCDLIPYLKIGDEIMRQWNVIEESEGVYSVGIERGQFRTIAEAHSEGDDIEVCYKIKGDAISLALLLLMSKPDGEDHIPEEIPVTALNIVSPTDRIQNAVFFQGIDIIEKYGIIEGDYCQVYNSPNESNNFGTRTVKEVGLNDFGSYVVVDGPPLSDETATEVKFNFFTQYAYMIDGCGLTGDQVDIQQFLYLKKLLGNSIQKYEFFITEEFNAREFINMELLRPSGLLQVPRGGIISVASTLPPIADDGTKVLSEENAIVTNLGSLLVKRSVNKHYYNAVTWYFNFDEVEEKPKQTETLLNQESYSRMGVGKKILKIESRGLRKDGATLSNIETQSRRYLDRYKGAAGEISLQFNLKDGLNIEVPDTVIFDGRGFNLVDPETGERDFSPRLMQAINKELNVSGNVKITLVNANFSTGARYGVIAPSSEIISGDVDRLKLKGIFVDSPDSEKRKWASKIGERIVVRSEDWSKAYISRIIGFDDTDTRTCIIDPIPEFSEDLTYMDTPPYDEADFRKDSLAKQLHCFLNPRVEITESVDSISFKVAIADTERFKQDTYVNIHNEDFSEDFETQVASVDGDLITLKKAAPFTPGITHIIDLIGFKDGGLPYRLL